MRRLHPANNVTLGCQPACGLWLLLQTCMPGGKLWMRRCATSCLGMKAQVRHMQEHALMHSLGCNKLWQARHMQ